MGKQKCFSKEAKTWFSWSQMKSYGQKFHGNQYAGKMSTAKNVSKGFKMLGWGIGLYNQGLIIFDKDMSLGTKTAETASNTFSTFGGIWGAS